MEDELITIPVAQNTEKPIVKVMGVGGGGCNSTNFLYKMGIANASMLVCNTDRQSLSKSPVPEKLQLGSGDGAGGKPNIAKQYAQESKEAIKAALSDGTQMLFLLAGMGGGTGTGASPLVAEIAQEIGILTVGIVTTPYNFEGKVKMAKAITGIRNLVSHLDSLIVINNEKIAPDVNFFEAFVKMDEVVASITKSIVEIITISSKVNTDFADVKNTLTNGKVTIIGTGKAHGENRVTQAFENALDSPVVNDTEIRGAKRILLQINSSTENSLRKKELDELGDLLKKIGDDSVEIQWGMRPDESMGEDVEITIVATGYESYVFDNGEILNWGDSQPIIVSQPENTPAEPEVQPEQPPHSPIQHAQQTSEARVVEQAPTTDQDENVIIFTPSSFEERDEDNNEWQRGRKKR